MSAKERVVFLDRAAFTADDLPIPHIPCMTQHTFRQSAV